MQRNKDIWNYPVREEEKTTTKKEWERRKKVKGSCGTQSGETVSTLLELQDKRERDTKYI